MACRLLWLNDRLPLSSCVCLGGHSSTQDETSEEVQSLEYKYKHLENIHLKESSPKLCKFGPGFKVLTGYNHSIYQWLSARLQYLQCVSNADTAVLHNAIDCCSSTSSLSLSIVKLILAYWRHMATKIWINSGNGLLSLPEPILTYHQRASVVLSWHYFHSKCPGWQSFR